MDNTVHMEVAALQALNAELEEEVERLRVQVATLEDKLAQKEGDKPQECEKKLVIDPKLHDYQKREMYEMMYGNDRIIPTEVQEMLKRKLEQYREHSITDLARVSYDESRMIYRFSIRADEKSEWKHCEVYRADLLDAAPAQMDARLKQLSDHLAKAALGTMYTELTPAEQTRIRDGVANVLLDKLFQVIQPKEYFDRERGSYQYTPVRSRSARPDRPGEHPRSPFQKGGR